jgi:hypothetical protein
LDTAEKKMQLLYTDMTEEEVSGTDFEELLRNRHLMLAGLQGPGYTNCSTGMVLAALALQLCAMRGCATCLCTFKWKDKRMIWCTAVCGLITVVRVINCRRHLSSVC